jgi:hypothetical protein
VDGQVACFIVSACGGAGWLLDCRAGAPTGGRLLKFHSHGRLRNGGFAVIEIMSVVAVRIPAPNFAGGMSGRH